MDFKVTGSKDGITACQMDIKIAGLSYEILEQALNQARDGRLHILGEMMKTIDAPRTEMKPHAPKMVSMEIAKDFIGAVIGPGGKVIQGLQAETETTITIEEVDDVGKVAISGTNQAGIDEALARIKSIAFTPEVGEVYKGKVKAIQPYGAFIEIGPNTQGLLHISEIEWRRLEKVEDVLKVDQEIDVKLLGMERGKMKLSRKVLLPKPEKKEEKKEETKQA
jgi:polyribonucleotide nucleotidyltransferase